MSVVIHTQERKALDANLLARWRKVPTAVAADVSKGACLVDPALRPLLPPGRQPRLFGRAVTARCAPPDFGAVLAALDLVVNGDVLVIDAQGAPGHAMIGGILGGFLHRRSATGIVCDGAVRDVAELAGFADFPVFTRSITPRGPTAVVEGEVNGNITVGGRTVSPGDVVIGDDDGLVVLTPTMLTALIDACEAKLALEDTWIAGLKSGRSVADVFGLG
jgi:4-hydroxy-4-methyl-2-oxoglutarate aldolase